VDNPSDLTRIFILQEKTQAKRGVNLSEEELGTMSKYNLREITSVLYEEGILSPFIRS